MSVELVSVNVGRPRQLGVSRRGPVISAIGKAPVTGRITVGGVNLAGDDQADRELHGGPNKAVYAYASEDITWWADQLGRELGPGSFGENLTTQGVAVSGAVIGERWLVGSTELEVCQPRQPCYKLGLAFGDPQMVRRFAQADRPGAYLRIVRGGELGAGDVVEVVSRPEHGITVAFVSRAILSDRTLLLHAASAPALPEDLAAWMRTRAPRGDTREN
jgi:MOSC domain-containing protein YiiM